MKVDYFLEEKKKENLYCRLSDDTQQLSFSMKYEVDPEVWDSFIGNFKFDDENHDTLNYFSKYLIERYEALKKENNDDLLVRLENETLSLSKNFGLNCISEHMFDYFNKGKGVPEYKDFIKVFEKFSKLKKGEYKVKILDDTINFLTKDKEYEADTFEGMSSRLKYFVDSHSYEDLAILTNSYIWNELLVSESIEKHKFLPNMLQEWRIYWQKELKLAKDVYGFDKRVLDPKTEKSDLDGENDSAEKNNNINELAIKLLALETKQIENVKLSRHDSWEDFQVFMACYDDTDNILELASEIDEMTLYPIALVTLLRIINEPDYYSEYSDIELCEENGWKSAPLDEDNDDSLIFYFREQEAFEWP